MEAGASSAFLTSKFVETRVRLQLKIRHFGCMENAFLFDEVAITADFAVEEIELGAEVFDTTSGDMSTGTRFACERTEKVLARLA